MECRVTAVLVAAGSSTRMGFDKLSFDLGGETVLERSVRAFDECPEVDELQHDLPKRRKEIQDEAQAEINRFNQSQEINPLLLINIVLKF